VSEQSPSSIERKILDAAIECIERYGINGTTNRKIAAIAGVNSAAINYYFRSKETLVQRVMQVTLENAFDWKDIEKLPGATPRERCAAVFNDIVKGGCNYPGITRAHFYEILNEGNYDSQVVERFSDFIGHLADDLQARGSTLEKNDLRLACMQIATASMMMVLAPRLFEKEFGVNMIDDATREHFIGRLVDRLL
jgi:AcrR family transcriptional regulator